VLCPGSGHGSAGTSLAAVPAGSRQSRLLREALGWGSLKQKGFHSPRGPQGTPRPCCSGGEGQQCRRDGGKCPLCNSRLAVPVDSPASPLGDTSARRFNVLLTYFLHAVKTPVIKMNLELSSRIALPVTRLNFVCVKIWLEPRSLRFFI